MIFSCFQLMKERIDFETDEEWIASEFKEPDPDHIDHCKLGTASLLRCFDTLGINSSWSITTQVLNRYLKSQNMLEQDAAISALSAMSYYMDDIESHQKLFHLVLPFIGGSPRTSFKAISFLALSSDVLTYDASARRIIIPALLNQTTKQTQPSARIRAHALDAVGQFLENQLRPEETADWADAALGRFTTACTEGPLMVMENAITAIGSFAASSPASSFNKYYSVIMPILKNLLNSTSSISAESQYKPADFFVLRSKALETISILFTATDVGLIAADMTDIMTTTAHFDLDNLDASDPFKTFVIKMWMRISKVTGPAFVPYLPHIMPEIIKSLEVSVTCEVPSYHDSDSDDYSEGDEEERENDNWMNNNLSTIVKEDGSKILVQTTQIEEQSAALHATLFLTSNLQHHMYPYAARICLSLEKLITNGSDYLHASESLEYAIIALTELVRAVKRHETFDVEAKNASATRQTMALLLRVVGRTVCDDNVEVQECCFQAVKDAIGYANFDYRTVANDCYNYEIEGEAARGR